MKGLIHDLPLEEFRKRFDLESGARWRDTKVFGPGKDNLHKRFLSFIKPFYRLRINPAFKQHNIVCIPCEIIFFERK